jgi:hypothetical protein
MSGVFNDHAQRVGIPVRSLCFLLHGEFVSGEEAVGMLELDDECSFYCFLEQGGPINWLPNQLVALRSTLSRF